MNKILRPLFSHLNVSPFETKRFAGHSKWKNIKHTKEKADSERAVMTDKFLRRMRAAIAECGSASPEQNMKLAYLVDQAKKKNIPNNTVKAFLEKMQNTKTNCQNIWINVQGPDGCLVVFHLVTDNVNLCKHNINTMLRKNKCKLANVSVKGAFDVEGVILTEKFCDIDAATDIAIEIGAEEVCELEKDDKTYLKFTCDPSHLMTVKHNLEKQGHNIISAEEEYIPESLTEVSDEGLNYVSKLIDRVQGTGDLVHVYDNIA